MARPRALVADAVPWVADGAVPPTRDAHGQPLIRLQTLGAAVVQCGEMRIGPSAGVLFALLMRLTHAPAMRVPRDLLLQAVWPEQSDVRRRASLRQALYKLRGFGVRVGLDGDVVQLDTAQIVRTFANERTAIRFERDVTTGHEPFGVFLPGYIPPTEVLEEWVNIEREAVHAEVRHVLVAQLRARRERADWSGAEALARWLLRFDPLHEDATLTIAECTMLAGAKAEAIAILDRYLADIGPGAGDIRLPAVRMRRRFVEATRGRLSFAPTERHFVGREDEMSAFTLAMRRARWREGSAVLLHAPSGMGKTRLTLELGKVATIESVHEVRASCCESDGLRILSVLVEMLPELMAQPGALGCEPESLATLRRLVPESRPIAQATKVVPVDVADVAVDSATVRDGESFAERSLASGSAGAESALESVLAREPLPMPSSIRRAIVDLVAAVSDERPLMIVVDNVHWIDSASWEVLADIMDRISEMRVVVLLTSRAPYACAVRPERVPNSLVVRELAPLKAESSAALARLISEDLSAPVSTEICAWFVDACEGNPLFLRSLVNHWIETGEAGGVPPTLQQVIEQRISKLTPDALRTLQVIALLGELATVDRAQRVLEQSTGQLLGSLEELARAGAFRESATSTLLCHELLGLAAVSSLGRPAKKLLSLKIAETLVADPFDEGETISLAVLDHFRAADEIDRIAEFTLIRGEEWLQAGYPTRALALCDSATHLLPAGRDDRALARVESEALYLAGRYARLLELTSRMEVDFSIDSGWDASHPNEVLNYIETARHADSATSYQDLCARAVMLAESTSVPDNLRLRAATTAIKVGAHGLSEQLPTRAYQAGLSVVDGLDDSMAHRALLDMYFHTSFGDSSRALAAARAIRTNYLPFRNPRDRCYLGGDVGYALRVNGAVEEARAVFKSVYENSTAVGAIAAGGVAAWYLSMIALDVDSDVGLAGAWIARCEALPGASDEALLRHLCEQQRVRLAVIEGRAHDAVIHTTMTNLCSVNAPNPKRLAYTLALHLAIALLNDDAEKILELLPAAERRFSALKGTLGQDYLASQVLCALRRQGRDQDAEDLFSAYIAEFRRERFAVPKYLCEAAKSEIRC